MTPSELFSFSFLDTACAVELHGGNAAAGALFHRYLEMFPAFAAPANSQRRYTVRIHDLASYPVQLAADDPIFGVMRDYFATGYGLHDGDLVERICSPAFVPDAQIQEKVSSALARPGTQGLSLQKDFLVLSDREAGIVEAFADIGSSLQEAWAFHVLNFFKIFFFHRGAIRLHGSGATTANRALLLLANTGGGKSTMKNFFLRETPAARPFTDDSILAVRDGAEFRLYQDPVEFMRWAYMPAAQLGDHVIPKPRAALTGCPVIYYLDQAERTDWQDCAAEELFERINQEAFFQRGFLTQRFIPQPHGDRYLAAYFQNSRDFLSGCTCRLAGIRHHDDYSELFAQWRRDLGLAV